MVVFTCGHCGESLQKPKVEKHYLTKCRNRSPNLSCMDCFKDFLGNDYEAHIKCITEEERYSGKGFTAKEKKGEKKQNAWVEMLQSVLDEAKTTSPNVLRIVETISKHNNTPRKKPKFVNFVKNVCGQKTNPKDIDQAWDLISVKLSALSNFNGQNRNQSQNNEETKINGKCDDSHQDSNKEEKESENKENDEVEKQLSPKLNGHNNISEKKLSKKERKEEKKRRKYEAELQSAEQQPAEETNDEVQSKKKGKKNKNKVNNVDKIEDGPETDEKNKIKKRKRQDTVNTIPDVVENEIVTENTTNKIKVQQKKQRVQEEEEEVSASLHDQNVAKSEEPSAIKEKFNWHAVIISVLQKKDNEVPFKRLQKKVLGEYSEITGYEIDDRIAEKFIKKLKSAPNVRVDKNRVLLIGGSND